MSFYRAVFRLLSDSIAEFSKDNSEDLIPEWYPTFGEHLFNSSTLRKDVLRGTESSLSGGYRWKATLLLLASVNEGGLDRF